MASRPIVPPQHRGVEPLGANKQTKKNVAGAEVRGRRALGDIGNLATFRAIDGKAIPQRPLTRSFCAQLIANAQAAVVAEPNKEQKQTKKEVKITKPPTAVVPALVPNKETAKPEGRKVVNVQSKPAEVIEISPESRKSSKEKRSFSSILTARSKALEEKPKNVVDIDSADVNNPLTATEYVEDMFKFYKEAESECLPCKYMEMQPEINPKMRAILVDWIIDVHNKFDLSPETLYLTINIIDRFLSLKTVPRKELQLLGIGAMFTASKYEEIWAPEANDLVLVSDRAYSHQQILLMEKAILQNLQWTLTVPTHFVFLARFIKASIPDKLTENMVYYLAELGLMDYDMMVGFSPSMMAASAVYAARCTLTTKPAWTETLEAHTGYSEKQLTECAGMLADLHAKAREETKLRAVMKKYLTGDRETVLKYQPAKALLAVEGLRSH